MCTISMSLLTLVLASVLSQVVSQSVDPAPGRSACYVMCSLSRTWSLYIPALLSAMEILLDWEDVPSVLTVLNTAEAGRDTAVA